METNVDSVELWYDSLLLGRVAQVVEEDGVSSGVIRFSIANAAEPLARSLLRYVEFCVDWNERARTERTPPLVSEFDAFASLVKSRKWFAKSADVREEIEDAPVFFRGNEVSWRAVRRTRS